MSTPAHCAVLPSQPRPAEKVTHWAMEHDVVVVGHGVAGGAAAIEAARAGSDTLMLERASRGGGATALSEGTIYFGGGTRVQQACDFDEPLENMLRHVQSATGPTADPEKVRLYCEGSLDHFRWFCELGVEFKDSYYAQKAIFPPTDDCLLYTGNEQAYPFSEQAKPVPRGHKPKREGSAGGYIMECIIQGTINAGVTIMNDALVETLIQDENKRIVGVIAEIDKQEVCIKARQAVILTAGGFIMNKEMVSKFAPSLARCNYPIGSDGDDGRGIRMGMGAGGAAINMHEGLTTTPFFPPASHIKGIMVDARGQRFINEDCYHGRVSDAIIHKADGTAYLIVDDDLYGQTPAFHKIVAVEETFSELEKALNMPGGSLTHTIETYNHHAEKGEDPLFHKAKTYLRPLSSSPYAALECSVDKAIFAAFTLGGLDTRPTGEVQSVDGEIVQSLFAAGRTSAGLSRSGKYYASGMSIGGSSFFGRLAGKQAAKVKRID